MCNGYSSHRYKVRFIYREVPSREEGREGNSTYPILHSTLALSHSFSLIPLSSPRSNSISSRFSFFFPLSLFFSTVAINVSTFQRHREMKSLLLPTRRPMLSDILLLLLCYREKPCTRRVDQKFSLQATREIKQMQHANLFCSFPV